MYRFLMIAVLALTTLGGSITAQTLNVYGVNTSKFPTIVADYVAFDSQGNPLTGLTAADFRVTETARNGSPIDVTPTVSHKCTTYTTEPEASIIIVLDRSNSMRDVVNGKPRFEYCKDAIRNFVARLKWGGETRVSLVTFAGNYEVSAEWADNPDPITDTLRLMEPLTSTNYNMPFDNPGNNIYELFKKRPANIPKYVFFLTDGHPNPGITPNDAQFTSDNSTKLLAQNIRFFSITILQPTTYPVLEALSRATGGKSVVTNEQGVVDLFGLLALETQVTQVCQLSWVSPYGCNDESRSRTATVTLLRSGNPTSSISYTTPETSVARVEISDPVLFCGDPLPNQFQTADVTITARNAPLRVTGFTVTPTTYFTVIDWNVPQGAPFAPFTLQPGQSRKIRVRFTQGSQQIFRQAILAMEGTPCPPTIDLIGGQGLVQLLDPDGGELFSTCDTVTIKWFGVLPTQPVKLEYSTDGGATWGNIIDGAATGNSYKWLPPAPGANYKIKVSVAPIPQFQWVSREGGTGNDTAAAVSISPDDVRVLTAGYFNGPTQFGTTTVNNSVGNIDGYLLEWTADGILSKARLLTGSGNNDDRIIGVIHDKDGNFYVAGSFNSPTVTFDTWPGLTLGTGDSRNMFIYKFDKNGNLAWRNYGQGSGLNTSYATATKLGIRYNAGVPEVVVQGVFQRFVRVGQQPSGGWEESARYTNSTNRNYYVVYNTNGYATLYENAVAPTTGASAFTMASTTATDSYGFQYETGHFTGPRTWSPPNITHNSRGGTDVFLSKFGSIPSSSDSSTTTFSIKAPQLTLSTNSVIMDPIAQGQTSSKSFTAIICNTGDFPVQITSETFGGANATDFKLLGSLIGQRLNPGDCFSIELAFSPSAVGNRTAVLDITGSCNTFVSLQISGQGLPPCAYDVKSSIDLGKIPQGTTPSFPVPCIIKNTGPAALSGTITVTGSADMTVPEAGAFTLQPNECKDVTVNVNAQTAGTISITINYGLAAECGVPTSTITAEIVEPRVSITNVDFLRKRVLTVSNDVIKITNLNTEPAVITGLTLSDAANPHLTFTLPGTPINLAPNASVDIPVRYEPQARGAHLVTVSATIQGQSQPIVGEAKGIGFLPAIDVKGYTFAAWTVGQQSPEQGSVVITNTDADADLVINNIRFAAATIDFAWASALPGLPQTLSPGQSIQLPVNFTPQAIGTRTVQVCVEHDAKTGPGPIPPYAESCVDVTGIGIEPSTLPPVNMGNVLTCASKTQTVRITNPNPTLPLNCDAPVGTGDLAAFVVTPNAAFTVPAGGSIDITVVYTPPAVGPHSATYAISNDQGLALNLNVSGTGVTTTADFRFKNIVPGIVGQGAIMPIEVNVGALDTVKVTEVVLNFSFNPQYVAFKQLTTPSQTGWTFVPTFPAAGSLTITGTSQPGATLVDGDFVTPEFQVYLTADSSLPVTFTATLQPSCVVATGDNGTIAVKMVCYAEGRLVKIGSSQFAMEAPQPNPAREATTIPYATGIELATTFELIDAMGNIVKTVETPVLKSGQYELTLETTTLPSGMYILRMVSGPYTATQAISVVK